MLPLSGYYREYYLTFRLLGKITLLGLLGSLNEFRVNFSLFRKVEKENLENGCLPPNFAKQEKKEIGL
jgi:hypothetical protein